MASKRFEGWRRFASIGIGVAMAAAWAPALLASPRASWGRQRRIEVHTLEGLYAAIDASANCGSTAGCGVTIHLAPGTYVLSARSSGGRFHPRGGALRLPPGVSLIGSEQHVDTNGDGVLDPIDPDEPRRVRRSGHRDDDRRLAAGSPRRAAHGLRGRIPVLSRPGDLRRLQQHDRLAHPRGGRERADRRADQRPGRRGRQPVDSDHGYGDPGRLHRHDVRELRMRRAPCAVRAQSFAQRPERRPPHPELLHGRCERRSHGRPRDPRDGRLQSVLRQRHGPARGGRRRGRRRRLRDAPHGGQRVPRQRDQSPAPRRRRSRRASGGREPAGRDVRVRHLRGGAKKRVFQRGRGRGHRELRQGRVLRQPIHPRLAGHAPRDLDRRGRGRRQRQPRVDPDHAGDRRDVGRRRRRGRALDRGRDQLRRAPQHRQDRGLPGGVPPRRIRACPRRRSTSFSGSEGS